MNLKSNNEKFYSRIFPDVSYINQVGVIHKNIILFGPQGSSKTQTGNTIISQAFKKYGSENVNSSRTRKDLKLLLDYGIDSRYVQILFADDLTLSRVNTKELEDFYNVRHILEEQGRETGLVITLISVHDFFAIPKNLRSFFDALVICAPPTNMYDRNFIKGYIGKNNLFLLDQIFSTRTDDFMYLSYKIFWMIGATGILDTPKLNEYYFVDLVPSQQQSIKYKTIWDLMKEPSEGKVNKVYDLNKRKPKNRKVFPFLIFLLVVSVIMVILIYGRG